MRNRFTTLGLLFRARHAFLVILAVAGLLGSGPALSADLDQAFRSPPDAAKPWAYWWWLNANVTKESITHDLEAMKSKGFGGFLLFDVTAYGQHIVPSPERHIAFMSPAWHELVKHAIAEAGRLGLQASVNLSTCGGALRAPWTTGQQAPKGLVWSVADVVGPKRLQCVAPRLQGPESWDVAIVAARISADGSPASPVVTGDKLQFSNDPDHWHQAVQSTVPPRVGKSAKAVPKPKPATTDEVIDLTGKLDAEGRLTWDVPEGRWRVIRFLSTIMKGPEAEWDVDMLDSAAVEAHFNRFGKAIMEDAGPRVGKTLTHFYSVSWEGAIPTWTFGFDREFQKYRGYSLRPYLPVLAGMTVKDPEVSQRFMRDFGRTLGDCFMTNCYSKLGELCHRAGLQWHAESGGPWRRETLLFAHADALTFWGRNDMPQGEFWWTSTPTTGRSNAIQTAMAAHVYGRPLASIEAFTHMRPHWSAYPATLKPSADAAFCDGINLFIWHTFSASPPAFGKPGIEYFAGTHINPNITWWDQAGGVLAYLARCQTMLRQGRFVADVCCYRSDKNYTAWNRDTRNPRPSLGLPQGYAMDLLNTEVLLERLSVKDGLLVLPDGMNYRLLWVDPADEPIPPQALQKVLQLVRDGATVVLGPRQPQRAPGLKDYPACDEEVRRLAAGLWGFAGNQPSRRTDGRGKILVGETIEKALKDEKILPDCAGPCEFNHRRTDAMDVYFVAGTGDAEYAFRVQGKEPELWDPVTGTIRDAVCYRTTDDGRTIVPIRLPEHGSVFVVFRRPAQAKHLVEVSGPESGLQIAGRSEVGACVRLWQDGEYVLRTSPEKAVTLGGTAIPAPLPIAGPWTVCFAPGWGAPASIVFDELLSWDKHPNDAIKHFSGKATYRKTFALSAEQAKGLVRLQLGDVKYVAQVRVNKKDLGVVWTSPWTVDLTGLVKAGENDLEIDVVNLWVNRLIGDAGLPENQRRTKTNIYLQKGERTVKPYQGYSSKDPLVASGLLGPVRLEFGRQQEVKF